SIEFTPHSSLSHTVPVRGKSRPMAAGHVVFPGFLDCRNGDLRMSATNGDHERTMAFAEIAFGQIKALREPATPRNFEIWYTYATGYNPSLNQKINELLKAHGQLNEADLEEIHATYLAPSRLTDRIDTLGAQVMGEIDQVMSMIDAAAGTANSYSES